ncbi:MAG: DUF2341 domain-containing protein [Acidimicrobiales bacterium]
MIENRRAAPSAKRHRVRMFLAFALGGVLLASPAIAGLQIEDHLRGEIALGGDGIVLYDYETSEHSTFDSAEAWAFGAFDNTEVSPPRARQLAPHGDVVPNPAIAWWDTAWPTRQCVTVANSGDADDERPVHTTLDTANLVDNGWMTSDGRDLRAVDSSTGELIPLWIEGAVPSASTDVWVQLADIPVGESSFCFYVGNQEATAVSDELAVYTFPTRTTRYYTLTDAYDGSAGESGQVRVVSYADGVVVSNGTTQTTLNRGESDTFSGMTQHSYIDATGPISATGLAATTDALVPATLASTEFVFAADRGVQQFWVRSLDSTASIEVIYDNLVAATYTVTLADQAFPITLDAEAGKSVVIRSTNGARFLAAHQSGGDSIIGVPWLGQTIYGVQSDTVQIGSSVGGATISAIGSAGVDRVGELVGPNATVALTGGPTRPSGVGYAITSDLPIAAQQFSDPADGEATSFLPATYLDSDYLAPTSFAYATVVCPSPGTDITMVEPDTTTTTIACSSTGVAGSPGFGVSPVGSYPSGTRFEGSARFFLKLDKLNNDDDTNVLGPRIDLPSQNDALSLTTHEAEGALPAAGRWTTVIDTGNAGVFGLIDVAGSIPAGAGATVQMASADTAEAAAELIAVGPDRTIDTSYPIGTTLVPYDFDYHQFVKLSIVLTSFENTSPTLDTVSIAHNLGQLYTDGTATATTRRPGSTGGSTGYLARVRINPASPMTGTISYLSGTGLPDSTQLAIDTDHPERHVLVVDGSLAKGSGPEFSLDADTPFSILYTEQTAAGASPSLTVRLVGIEPSGFVRSNDLVLTIDG